MVNLLMENFRQPKLFLKILSEKTPRFSEDTWVFNWCYFQFKYIKIAGICNNYLKHCNVHAIIDTINSK